ncbi:MAG: type II toxin-antitoxin system HicB family antitoxin [Syntrophales bacterium]
MSKNLEYYRSIHYKMVWEYDKDDEVYFVSFPELPGCLAHGKTEQEALKTALKVKDEWLEATYAAGWEIPERSTAPETTGRITTRLPKYLHQKVIDRAEVEGVSQNQLILSFVAQGLEKARTEDSLKKIAATQDEMVRLLKGGQVVENIQPTWNPFPLYGMLANVPFYPYPSIDPYSSGLVYNLAPISGAGTAATKEINCPHSAAITVGEKKDRLRLVKPKATRAFEEDYQGGYAQ